MALGNPLPLLLSKEDSYEIDRSLRFEGLKGGTASGQLDRDFQAGGNPEKWTFAVWFKKCQIGTVSGNSFQHFIGPYRAGDGSNESVMGFNSSNQFRMQDSSGSTCNLITNRLFRDVSAWQHCVVAVDTTQGTASNRVKIYFNGVQETSWATETYPAEDYDMGWNKEQLHAIGRYAYPGPTSGANTRFNGYMTEIYWIDNQQLGPGSFGETNGDTGQWVPIKYTGTYGTTGFYLNFSDNSNTTASTLGADSSGNGNNWTPANFSVAAGVGNDSVTDTPTNNYPTLNPLNGLSTGFYASLNANLDYNITDTAYIGLSTMAVPTSGKWYAECTATEVESLGFGLRPSDWHGGLFVKGYLYLYYGKTWKDNAEQETVTAISDGDIVGCAVDRTAGTVQFSLNGTNKGSTLALVADEEYYFWVARGASSGGAPIGSVNFGQRAFSHQPTGFVGLCTSELPTPTIKKGSDHFNTVLYTGTGSSQTIDVGFAPNFTWIKKRNASENHELQDTVRGATKRLTINDSSTEATVAGSISAFTSSGFTVVDAGTTNENTHTYAAWNWKESASAGFDIVAYTGNGQDDTDVAISHSLGVSPELVLVRNRSTAKRWQAWNKDLDSGKNAIFSDSVAQNTYSSYIKAVSSSTFTVRDNDADGNGNVNKNGDNYIAYLWTSVAGFSKISSYDGNGNANGIFVYTGFKVSYLMVKNIDRGANWTVYDTKRKTFNSNATILEANINNAEETGHAFDFLSNGFKVRNSNNSFNASGETMIYMAFAEAPFKYANAR